MYESLLWEPYPSYHNGLFSPLLVRRDFAARRADHHLSEPLQLPGSTSAGRVICSTDLTECVSVPGDFLRPQEAFLPGIYPLRGRYRPVPLIRGMPTGPQAFLGNAARVWATALRPDSPKKGLVPHLPVTWGEQQIPLINIGVIRTVRDFLPFLCTLSFLCNIICYLISVIAFSLVTLSGVTTVLLFSRLPVK